MEANDIKVGQRVVYYNIIKEDGTKIDPKIVYIDSEPWEVGGQMVCKIVGIRGGVSIKHLQLLPESKWTGLKFENKDYYQAFERTLNRQYLRVENKSYEDCQWIVVETETGEVLQTHSGSHWLIGLQLRNTDKDYLVIMINDNEALTTDFKLIEDIPVPAGFDYHFSKEKLIYTDYCFSSDAEFELSEDDGFNTIETTTCFVDGFVEFITQSDYFERSLLKAHRIRECVDGFKGITEPLKMRKTWDSIKHLELDAYQNCRNDLDRALELLRSVDYDNPEIKDFVKSFDIPEESKTEEGAK